MNLINFLARALLVRILEALEKRFVSLRMSMNSVVQHIKATPSSQNLIKTPHQSSMNLSEDNGAIMSCSMDIGFVQPIKTSARFLDGSIDVLKGYFLFCNA